MKRLSLILLAFVNAVTLNAQYTDLNLDHKPDSNRNDSSIFYRDGGFPKIDEFIRYWDEGPLTFKDFSSRHEALPDIAELEYVIDWYTNKTKVGNTTVYAPVSRCSMNPFASWINPDYGTPEMLQYLQTGFDYVEICRRRAQKDFFEGSRFDYPQLMKYHTDVADSFIAKMKEETVHGLDTAAVRYYAERVRNELANTPEPQFTELLLYPKGFGAGIHFGVGSEFYTGTLAGFVNHVTGMDFGFDYTYNRLNFYMDATIGWGGYLKRDISHKDYLWNAGKKIGGGNMQLSFGYTAYDSQWWKIVPFAGIGVGFIDYPLDTSVYDKNSDEISGFRCLAGVSADFKFKRNVQYLFSARSLGEFSVRTRLYAAHNALPTPAPAWTVNLGVSFNMLSYINVK